MDWGRAKSVLIISFLLLNVLLGYQLWMGISDQLNANLNSAELPADKLLLMQQKGITLPANLPPETPKLSNLAYTLHSESQGETAPTPLKDAVDSALNFSKSELDKALKDQVPDIEQYQYDHHGSRDGVFVYHPLVDGYPMFNVNLEMYTSNLKITAFQQDRVELASRGKAEQVIPAVKVVASLIETYLENGAVIIDIQLGYHGQIFDSEKQVSNPSWRVKLEDGKVYYIHAISGEVETDSADESDSQAKETGQQPNAMVD